LLTAIDAVNLPLDYAAVRRALARGDILRREMFATDLAPAEIGDALSRRGPGG